LAISRWRLLHFPRPFLAAKGTEERQTRTYGNGDIFDIAAAYVFHIAQAQSSLDGNKRTAAGAALVFLK
jgi:death-on-curing protein